MSLDDFRGRAYAANARHGHVAGYLAESPSYRARHAGCDHAWGKCSVKVACNCQRFGLRSGVHYDNCELAQSGPA